MALDMKVTPTTEERIWAVLSHLSALTFGMGILLPVIGWAEQRRKSNYTSFQCLQALGYQSLGYTVWFLSYLLLIVVFFLSMLILFGVTGDGGNSFGSFMGIWMGIFIVIVFGFFVIYFILPIISAIACGLGKDFRYPILGNRLARYLGYDSVQNSEEPEWLIEDHENRWVAAMGHFSVIIALWGMLVPLAAWITQGKQSLFLKFQSIQMLIFQAVTLILLFVALFVYFFGFFLVFAAMGFIETQFGSSSVMITLILFGITSLVAMAIFLVIPMLHIFGQWAGFRILKGDDYRYPLIGRLVANWLAQSAPSVDGQAAISHN